MRMMMCSHTAPQTVS